MTNPPSLLSLLSLKGLEDLREGLKVMVEEFGDEKAKSILREVEEEIKRKKR